MLEAAFEPRWVQPIVHTFNKDTVLEWNGGTDEGWNNEKGSSTVPGL